MQSDEWHQLLEACRGDLSVALPAAGEIARGVRVQGGDLPEPGPRICARVTLHEGDLGDVSLYRWKADAPTLPQSRARGRSLHCLVEGTFHLTSWRWREGELIPVAERRVHAPDVLLVEPGQIHSLRAPQGGITLMVHGAADDTLTLEDTEARESLVVQAPEGPWRPDADAIDERRPWSKRGSGA